MSTSNNSINRTVGANTTNDLFTHLRASAGQWDRFNDQTDVHGYYSGVGSPEGVVAADIGSIYSDTGAGASGIYYKTTDTVSSGWTSIPSSGSGFAPTVQRFLSGSGTYTAPTSPSPLYLKVQMAGPGGGGGGSGIAPVGGTGSNGSAATTFGVALLTANPGLGGSGATVPPPVGGTATVNAPAVALIANTGGTGGSWINDSLGQMNAPGGMGGFNLFGGSGMGSAQLGGGAAIANTGAGGAGGGNTGVSIGQIAGNGGSAGGYIEAFISSPAASYAYSIGSGGAGGAAGGGTGDVGGAGAGGIIIVTEYYQ